MVDIQRLSPRLRLLDLRRNKVLVWPDQAPARGRVRDSEKGSLEPYLAGIIAALGALGLYEML